MVNENGANKNAIRQVLSDEMAKEAGGASGTIFDVPNIKA